MDKSLRSDNIRGSWSFMVFHFTEGLVNEEDVAILAQNITKIFFNKLAKIIFRSWRVETERDCCRWQYLTFRYPERKSSLESSDDVVIVLSGQATNTKYHRRHFLPLFHRLFAIVKVKSFRCP